jgi:energy-coupling factor transporter ATP-binding protein EcfA2
MSRTALTEVRIENFTAFSSLSVSFSPGVNVLIGANGTGKTHLLKLLYSGCTVTASKGKRFAEKLVDVFLPYDGDADRLVSHGVEEATIHLQAGAGALGCCISPQGGLQGSIVCWGEDEWSKTGINATYIPAKEMLGNAPGFRSLYTAREVHFEEVYYDILDRAFLPPLRKGNLKPGLKEIVDSIRELIGGVVTTKGEHFFLSQRGNDLEFSLVAEGLRKLALLWLLIANGSVSEGSVLFWDEPETNLHPRLIKDVSEILMQIQRLGVQVFLATHSYVLLSELDLTGRKDDLIRYHSMYRDQESGVLKCESTDEFDAIDPNPILDTMADIYDRDVERTLGGQVS